MAIRNVTFKVVVQVDYDDKIDAITRDVVDGVADKLHEVVRDGDVLPEDFAGYVRLVRVSEMER